MHPSISITKFLVLVVSLATQYAPAKSWNVDSYSDEKFRIFEWITYLKRFSLIALMLCGVVLYYVPKSRSYARRACCVTIDLVANGLKFALCATESEYEKVRARDADDQSEEPRVQEIYRKMCKQGSRSCRQRYVDRVDNNDYGDNKLMRKRKRKIYRKHISHKKCERNKRDSCHHQNFTIKDIFSGTNIITAIDNRMTTAVEKCDDSVVGPQEVFPRRNSTCYVLMKKLEEDDTNLQRASIKDHEDNTAGNIESSSSTCKKADSANTVAEIDHKNVAERHKSVREGNGQRDNDAPVASVSDDLEAINYVPSNDVSHCQAEEDCTTRITDEQTANLRYGRVFAKTELHKKSGRENCRFLHDKNIARIYYENAPIITNRTKPFFSQVVNWLFGGCPQVSRRHRERIEEVGKEESFEITWLF